MGVVKKVVIVGGGTSGWMAAAALSKASRIHQLDITLIESSQIGTIGVGEGSTPYLKRFMDALGFVESDWMSRCDASYKTGIYFDNWNGAGSRYFHPFYSALDVKPAEIFFHCANARRRGVGAHITGDEFFISGHLAKLQRSPKAEKPLTAEPEYGYHFDAAKLAKVLKDYALNAGVSHAFDDVLDANLTENGDIESLHLVSGDDMSADLFVDASGFQSILIEKALKVQFESFSKELANDSAVAISTARDETKQPENYTISKALSAGWMWQIPLTSRTGNGYVYSSNHLTEAEAESELAAELNIDVEQAKFKHLKMRVGMRRTPWVKNVLAIGLSHSFIEPLEATALMVTQWGIESFIKALDKDQADIEEVKNKYNQQMTQLVLGVKEYIHGHYVTSQRRDTAYWQQVSSEQYLAPRLAKILSCWRKGEDFDALLYQLDAELAYFSPSWYALLAGMDYRDSELKLAHEPLDNQLVLQAKLHCENVAKAYFRPLPG
ncbi:tryptophan halogenase family protein [Shewanella sp. UCD-KL12]|uniref:tryptophan halogenase family protein n=1 Tax=Shewanella sp. UCD-KL12 TaxID=1917163 RepID=UPI00097149C6|nr:tryptophan halogenase family protein [Shewanella sp. UCD-KL12]